MTSYYLLVRYFDDVVSSADKYLNNDHDATAWAHMVRDNAEGIVAWQLYALGGTNPRLITQGEPR